MTTDERLIFWSKVILIARNFTDLNLRAVLIQTAIQEYGPVPDELGEKVRALLKND